MMIIKIMMVFFSDLLGNGMITRSDTASYIAVIFQNVKNLVKQVGQSKRPRDYDDKSKNINCQSRAEKF